MSTITTDRLQDIFRAVLELPDDADVARIDRETAGNWDSLAHVTLVAAIESEFGISLALSESLAMDSFQSAVELVGAKQG